jgi:DNA-binding NarL/FixJ family response regulator
VIILSAGDDVAMALQLIQEGADNYLVKSSSMLFPFKTMAAAAGLILLPLVSRLTARFNRARQLSNVYESEVLARSSAALRCSAEALTRAIRYAVVKHGSKPHQQRVEAVLASLREPPSRGIGHFQ